MPWATEFLAFFLFSDWLKLLAQHLRHPHVHSKQTESIILRERSTHYKMQLQYFPASPPSQQWHVGPRWGLHGRQMWAPLWACTRDPHWGQPWKPRRTKSGTCKGTAWVLIGQFMSARFGPHLPKGVKSGFAPGIHMGASRGCPDGF